MQGVHLRAFSESESEIVSRIAIDLLSDITSPPTISLVAEMDGDIVGHIAFSPVRILGDEKLQGYILAPLGVQPDYQNRRVGTQLIEWGLRHLTESAVNVVLVYGDPKYYGRFGFSEDVGNRFSAPYPLQYPAGWQGVVLNEFASEKTPVAIACVTPLCDPGLW